MDVARGFIDNRPPSDPSEFSVQETPIAGLSGFPFAVIADQQASGRGTGQRKWVSPVGNLYMSLVIPVATIPQSLVPVLPLFCGQRVLQGIERSLKLPFGLEKKAELDEKISELKLKWPNDVVGMEGKKMSGLLIETHNNHFIIGIGANVLTAPSADEVVALDDRRGRVPGCLADHFTSAYWTATAPELCEHIIKSFFQGLSIVGEQENPRQYVVSTFASRMDFGVMPKRNETKPSAEPDLVQPLRLNIWGHLEVRHVVSGKTETLSAEYLI